MNYLLDTHTFIWLDSVADKLSVSTRMIVEDTSNTIFVSLASVWEMQIKLQLGKLSLPSSLAETVIRQRQENQITLLPIRLEHIFQLSSLPKHHRDPFDRLLIA